MVPLCSAIWAAEQPWVELTVKPLCQNRQPPTVSRGAPYVIATGVVVFPLMQNLCHLTTVSYFTPSFRNILIQTGKQIEVEHTSMAFEELDYFGKADFLKWSGKSWIKDEAGVFFFCIAVRRWCWITKGWITSNFYRCHSHLIPLHFTKAQLIPGLCVYCRVPKTLKIPQPLQIKQWGQSIPWKSKLPTSHWCPCCCHGNCDHQSFL